ncbi:MAG: hypothetical protein IPL40_00665 [Proteobacteria bacterium]|nr:hypothetical protein [Pseudomonadota bacterium]
MDVTQSLIDGFNWLLRQREAFAQSVAEQQARQVLLELPDQLKLISRLQGPPQNLAEWQRRAEDAWKHLKMKGMFMGFAGPCGAAGAAVGASRLRATAFPRSGGAGALVERDLSRTLQQEIHARPGSSAVRKTSRANADAAVAGSDRVYMVPYLGNGMKETLGFVQLKNLPSGNRVVQDVLENINEFAHEGSFTVAQRSTGAIELRPTTWAPGTRSEWSARVAVSSHHPDGMILEVGGPGHALGSSFNTSRAALVESDFRRVVELIQNAVAMALN